MRSELVEIALPLPFKGPLTYIWALDSTPEPGIRVLVPVGRREMTGVLWKSGAVSDLPEEKLRQVTSLLDSSPLLPWSLMEFLEWAADYYFYPLGLAVSESMPPGFLPAKSRKVEQLIKRPLPTGRSRLVINGLPSKGDLKLFPFQQKAIDIIAEGVNSGRFTPILLHGVTGSGKTEVYIRAVKKCVETGRRALVLVPEIAMTSQISGWFMEKFGSDLTILHSGLTDPQRRDQWFRIRSGESPVVIGTRSGIFAPFEDIGLIIVDEEHDPSYKQDEKFLYNARDLAMVRGNMANATVILGSATPSVTSFYSALSKKFSMVSMNSRVGDRPLPEVQVVDRRLKQEKGKKRTPKRRGIRSWLSEKLEQAIKENFDKNEQTVLFLNRRGFATYVFCPDCGHVFNCKNCDVTMTWHRDRKGSAESSSGGLLKCHYCGEEAPGMQICPECAGHGVKATGFGTEKVTEELASLMPGIRILRIDRDTASSRKRLETALKAFREHEYDVLVGTQMITKGHDFPLVTLVGIIAADSSLNVPEYNASERTFQLVSQVSGRAGRGSLPGKVLIQTFVPDHYTIRYASKHDYHAFYENETAARGPLGYPPFGNMVNIRFSGTKKSEVEQAAYKIADKIRRDMDKIEITSKYPLEVLGPAPAAHLRINNRYRFQILVKSPSRKAAREICQHASLEMDRLVPRGVKVEFDVDPVKFG